MAIDLGSEVGQVRPRVEAVVVRDLDGGVDVQVFIDGAPAPVSEYVVDAGAGWDWDQWKDWRDSCLATASPATQAALLAECVAGPGRP